METVGKGVETMNLNDIHETKTDKLCETDITKDHVESILRDYFKTDRKLIDADAVVISKGLGFLSDVMLISLKWDHCSDKNGLPTKVIVKAPTIRKIDEIFKRQNYPSEVADTPIDFLPALHLAECNAYKILFSEKPPVPLASVYACWPVDATGERPALIAMEDLTERAGLVELHKGLSVNQWRNVVSTLADLHAWSLTTTTNWREILLPIESLTDTFKGFDQMALHSVNRAKEMYPEYFSDIDAELVLKEMHPDTMFKKHASSRDVMEDVIQHGDTWTNNIMFKKNPDGTITDEIAALIDWQVCVKGSCVNDICRLETWCLTSALRRANYRDMLRFYYDRLKSKSCDKLTISFEQMEELYEEIFVVNSFMAIVMVEALANDIVKADQDETGQRKREMLERVRASYDDAITFLNKRK